MWLLELLLVFNENDKSDLEQEEIKNGNYSSWNFEEEELEEDDYHFEDED